MDSTRGLNGESTECMDSVDGLNERSQWIDTVTRVNEKIQCMDPMTGNSGVNEWTQSRGFNGFNGRTPRRLNEWTQRRSSMR